ncbi:MAG TPA: HlyD family secretion protein [Tepidisphaeraceae bacterium]|nr:HlyD family secretion protein [Tepidisphaeraceae bacterium]
MPMSNEEIQTEAVAMSTATPIPVPGVITDAPNGNGKGNGQSAPPTAPAEPEKPRAKFRKRLVVGVILLIAAVIGVFKGVPELVYMLNHVSTDDAAVNSHLTYLSPRIDGVVTNVLVDDDQFVTAGTPLVQLDDTRYRLLVEQKQAALDLARTDVAQKVAALAEARAELAQARDQAQSQLAAMHGAWYLASSVLDLVHYESAGLKAEVDNLKQQQANLKLAQTELKNAQAAPAGISTEEIEQRQEAVEAAEDQVESAQASIEQTRALLELGPVVPGQDPALVPADLPSRFAATQYVLSSLQQDASQLGFSPKVISQTLDEIQNTILKLTTEDAIANSPAVRVAAARVAQAEAALGGPGANPADHPEIVEAEKELQDAELQLSYTMIRAPITGYVNRRSVNPGTHVEAGQDLLVLRSLNDVWIDANFKETQLGSLRVGQPVDIFVDAYPGHIFHGRVAGFSPGTGSVESLLPPENATGNYVKVVQRLTVRIDLTDPNSPKMPLLAGLSVEPDVDIKAAPTGPGAGLRLLPASVQMP